MLSSDDIQQRYTALRARMDAACERVGRPAAEVTLLPISKTHSPALIESLWEMGFREFGENRVQELREKDAHFAEHASVKPQWHFIGSLQRNKVKYVAKMPLALLHAVDSVELAREIDRRAEQRGQTISGLIEVNVSGEAAKHGFAPDQVREALVEMQSLPHLAITGLMTMAPFVGDPEEARPVFRGLRELRDRLQVELDCSLPVLSMGMSNDFEVAIEEGATIVRLGTALLGPRESKR